MKCKRHSTSFFLLIAALFALQCVLFVHAAIKRAAAMPALQEKRMVVKSLSLTDLCLFTEARYTRHPSVADFHSAFQDGPLSFEHFPSGSLITPPRPKRDQYDD